MKKILLTLIVLLALFLAVGIPQAQAAAADDLKKAQALYDDQKYQESLEKIEGLLDKNSYYRDALLLKGKAYYKIGEKEKAQMIWADLFRRDPSYKPVLFSLGEYYFKMKNFEESEKYYRKVLDLDTLNQESKLAIARIDIEKGLYEEGLSLLKEIERLNPLNPNLYFLYGEYYFKQKKFELAKENYIRSKNLDPDQAEVHARLAQLVQKENDNDAAEYHYNQAVILDNRNLDQYSKLGDFYLKQKEWPRVYEVYKQSEDKFKNDPVFYYNFAIAADKLGKTREALGAMESSLRLNSEDPFAQMLYYYKLRGYDELDRQKKYATSYLKKAKEVYNNGSFREALFYFRKGLKLNPGSEEDRYLFANCFKRLGMEKTYLKELKIATDLNPDVDQWNFQLERDERAYNQKTGSARFEESTATPTRILILPFESESQDVRHLEAGVLLAKEMELYLNNYFRIDADALEVTNLPGNEKLREYDYVVRGSYLEKEPTLKISASLYLVFDMARKTRYQEFTSDNNRVSVMMRNISKKLYSDVPFMGQVFRIDNNDITVNLGTKDDIQTTDNLVLYRPETENKFTVTKGNTLGHLKITKIYEDYLVATPTTRDVVRILRLYDKIQVEKPKPATAAIPGKK